MKKATSRRRLPAFILYLLYGCVLTVVLLVVFFPSEKIRLYVADKVEKAIPGTRCSIGSLAYEFPMTLGFKHVRLSGDRHPDNVLLSIGELFLVADWHRHGFRIHGRLYDGTFAGRVQVSREEGTFRLSDVRIRHLDLGKWEGLQRILHREITGFLDASGSCSGKSGHIFDGEAEGAVSVQEGSMALLQPVLELTRIHIDRSRMEFLLHDHVLAMRKGTFHGPEFDGAFTGTFHLAFPFESSMLVIKGDMTPTPSLTGNYRQWKNVATVIRQRYGKSSLFFQVNGTVTRPRFRLGR